MADPLSLFLWQQRVHLADNIRRLRAERGLTQVGLANLSLLSPGTILRLENPVMDSITLSTLARLAWALDIPITELLIGAEHNNENRDNEPLGPDGHHCLVSG